LLGDVFWVARSGKDSSPGTEGSPFKTIAKALSVVGPGDIVYIKPGTYVEHLVIRTSGQEGLPIVISAAPGTIGKVTITPSKSFVQANPNSPVIDITGEAEHVWINGLIIRGRRGRPGSPREEHFGANGISWSGGAGNGCRATNNIVYDNLHSGMKEMGHGGSHISIEGNIIFENGTTSLDHGIYAPSDDTQMIGNIIFNNAGWGIHSYSAPSRQRITHNILTGDGFGGILLAANASEVYHNVVTFHRWGIYYFREGSAFNVVKNNIFAFNTDGDAGYDNGGGLLGDPHDNVDDYNCYVKAPPPQIPPGPNEVVADPRFLDPESGDFRLRSNSSCIDRGTDLGYPFLEAAPDIGFFESDPSVILGVPAVTVPVPGTRLTQPKVTFRWIARGAPVTRWQLQVGSRVGASNYFSGKMLSGQKTSLVVKGLPNDGSQIFVRLWFRIRGQWEFADYQYTAVS
jgi:hypothetical protein